MPVKKAPPPSRYVLDASALLQVAHPHAEPAV